MVSRNLNIKWYTNVRADFLVKQGEEFLRKLEKAGCKMLTFGAESGTQRIMDMIDKNGDIADLYTIDKMIKKSKIIPHFCTIRGFPIKKRRGKKYLPFEVFSAVQTLAAFSSIPSGFLAGYTYSINPYIPFILVVILLCISMIVSFILALLSKIGKRESDTYSFFG